MRHINTRKKSRRSSSSDSNSLEKENWRLMHVIRRRITHNIPCPGLFRFSGLAPDQEKWAQVKCCNFSCRAPHTNTCHCATSFPYSRRQLCQQSILIQRYPTLGCAMHHCKNDTTLCILVMPYCIHQTERYHLTAIKNLALVSLTRNMCWSSLW